MEKIEVFGSFADPERHEVGDVDVNLLFHLRVDMDCYMELNEQAASEAEAVGHRFSTISDRLGYLEGKLKRYLKARSPRLDIHFGSFGMPEGVSTRVVFHREVD